ncbi:MAG: hypothetical protein JSW34_06670, partial [Candidatus Zixiibacteriota bacterium]
KPGPGPGRFERLRMKKLLELLELEGKKRDTFIEIAGKYRDRRIAIAREHMSTVDSLGSGLRNGKLGEDDIQRLVDRLHDLEVRQNGLRSGFHKEVKPLLTLEQLGKLVVFEYRFEARVLDRMSDLRRDRFRKGREEYHRRLGESLTEPPADSTINEN